MLIIEDFKDSPVLSVLSVMMKYTVEKWDVAFSIFKHYTINNRRTCEPVSLGTEAVRDTKFFLPT